MGYMKAALVREENPSYRLGLAIARYELMAESAPVDLYRQLLLEIQREVQLELKRIDSLLKALEAEVT